MCLLDWIFCSHVHLVSYLFIWRMTYKPRFSSWFQFACIYICLFWRQQQRCMNTNIQRYQISSQKSENKHETFYWLCWTHFKNEQLRFKFCIKRLFRNSQFRYITCKQTKIVVNQSRLVQRTKICFRFKTGQ